MSRKRHQRGGKAKGVHSRKIEDLHYQINIKDIQQWRRQQVGRFHCLVFGSPNKPKLQAKENFLVSHMKLRGEA